MVNLKIIMLGLVLLVLVTGSLFLYQSKDGIDITKDIKVFIVTPENQNIPDSIEFIKQVEYQEDSILLSTEEHNKYIEYINTNG